MTFEHEGDEQEEVLRVRVGGLHPKFTKQCDEIEVKPIIQYISFFMVNRRIETLMKTRLYLSGGKGGGYSTGTTNMTTTP